MGDYCVRRGGNGEWGIYSTASNVRIATFTFGANVDRERIAKALASPQPSAEAAHERMSDANREWLRGMSVSVDVSTDDESAGNRYFGTVTEVMDDGSKHGVILLVQDAKPNFEPAPVPAGAVSDEVERLRMDNEALKSVIHDEIAANLAFREAGGALPDEDMPTFCARLLAELNCHRLAAKQRRNEGEKPERWVTQTRFFDPSQPLNVCTGNCTEASLASIFGIALSEVPSFYGLQSSDYWNALYRFVESRGFWLARMNANYVPKGMYLADGPSERGCGHFVVMRNGELIHDPHPSRAGLKSIEHVWMFVAIDPSQARIRPQPSASETPSAKDAALIHEFKKACTALRTIASMGYDSTDKEVADEALRIARLWVADDGHDGLAPAPVPAGAVSDGEHREFLGKLVRMEWMAWAKEQPTPKPSWLLPWDQLTEPEREVDRRIGERIYSMAIGALASHPAQAVSVPEGWYGPINGPKDALYESMAALDNGDVALEQWPEALIAALARADYAVVPVALPHELLGRAAIAGMFDTGNPKHGWDYLVANCRAYPASPSPPQQEKDHG